MAGIINYYHGECGQVVDRKWIADASRLSYIISLTDDPHRQWAQDYGSDIAIDPVIDVGDRVTYVRLDGTCGIWVQDGRNMRPQLNEALARARPYTEACRKYLDFAEPEEGQTISAVRLAVRRFRRLRWLKHLQAKTGVSVERKDLSKDYGDRYESIPTKATFFISYSSANVLMARQLCEEMEATAKVNVWFDRAHSGELPQHDTAISAWLHQAVDKCCGLVLLWTRQSAGSEWVRNEIAWAKEKARQGSSFKLILLKLENIPVPASAADAPVIDVQGLWWSNGINEELFAALYERPGRRAWLNEHRNRGLQAKEDTDGMRYEDFRSDAGIAHALRSWFEGEHFLWELIYRKGETFYRVRSRGMACAVDLNIQKGDRIAFFVCHRRMSSHIQQGIPVWMRSDDLSVTIDQVISTYCQKLSTTDYEDFGMLDEPGRYPPPFLFLD